MKRRDFCRSSLQLGLLSLGSSVMPLRLWANPTPGTSPRFFILFNLNLGWDTSLCTDPWLQTTRPDPADFFIEYTADQVLPMGANFVGPALAPLKDFFDRLCIVNGVFMSRTDGGHPSASLYAQTGNGEGHLGVVSAELETRAFNSPFGILADSAIYTAGSSRMIWDMNGLVTDGKIDQSGLLLNIDDKNSELAAARQAILSNMPKIDVFNQDIAKLGPISKGSAVAAAFLAGLSSSVSIQITHNLDTHASHPGTHMKELIAAFTEVQGVLQILKQTPGVGGQQSLLDQTTVMMVSEFTRTPALNTSSGKNHNPQCNSAILMGPGIKPGIVGASNLITRSVSPTGDAYLVGLPLDKDSLQVVTHRDNAFILRPESVVATVAQSLGVNPAQISQELGAAPVLKTVLR